MARTDSQGEADYSAYPEPQPTMRVVLCLDSNVYLRHGFGIALLQSIESYKQYFAQWELLVPEVVLRECGGLYEEKAAKASKAPGFRPPEIKKELESVSSHVDELFARHYETWIAQLKAVGTLASTTDSVLRAAYERLMAKVPPCHMRDEMRDAIIWESLVAEMTSGYDLGIFITDNTSDFPFQSNPRLIDEATASKIIWFKTYSDLQGWLGCLADTVLPAVGRPTVTFRELYESLDLKQPTEERLVDELDEYLSGLTVYYDSDPEIYDLEQQDFEFTDETNLPDGNTEYRVTEKWDLSVSFGLSGDFHLGGSDGIDLSASGHGDATGVAEVERTFVVSSEGEIIEDSIVAVSFELEYDDTWDPQEAWVDSLGGEHDDA